MKQRTYCLHCNYPQKTCVCSSVTRIDTHSYIDILQHPTEIKAAKNTARLAALCLPKVRIWSGENSECFTELQKQLQEERRPIALLHPDFHAISLKEFCARANITHPQGQPLGARFLVLDGTWKKAYKIKQLNPWLNHYPSIAITARKRNPTNESDGGTLLAGVVPTEPHSHRPEFNCIGD